MPTNFQLTRDWINMAMADWKTACSARNDSNYGPCVYHLQQFAEKLTKAAIWLFGEEPEPIHFPSKQLRRIKDLESKEMPNEAQKILTKIMTLVITLEDERTRPRYGVRHQNGIISPQEYYSEEIITLFFEDVQEIANDLARLLETITTTGFEEEIIVLREVASE